MWKLTNSSPSASPMSLGNNCRVCVPPSLPRPPVQNYRPLPAGKEIRPNDRGCLRARPWICHAAWSQHIFLRTNGPDQIKRPLSPLPAPLLVHLHKRSTSKSLDALTEQILKFTSMTWRSTSPAAMPVTIYYSEFIAELLARFRTLPDWSPALLNTKLRASKWFL